MAGKLARATVKITGVVQGVGFRPFLYNLARGFHLVGTIQNRGNFGVEVVLEGPAAALEAFVSDLRGNLPSVSYIEDVSVEWGRALGEFHSLEIVGSGAGRGKSLVLPPDIAICDQCVADFNDPSKPRYHNYEFVACAGCGPRFTTVTELPYDRERTTMDDFPLCPYCRAEYSDPDDRRFHAQTFACRGCGPKYSLYFRDGGGTPRVYRGAGGGGTSGTVPDYLPELVDLLKSGKIVAVKGLGGVHLVCRADDDGVISKLRARKRRRKNKPFAVMCPDLETVRQFARPTPVEESLLTSFRRPIVLVRQGDTFNDAFSPLVAPGLDTVGVLLPYMGLHLLLFRHLRVPGLVFTSGNATNLPMATGNEDIFTQLDPLADAFLVHDRRIFQRCDDSVVKVVGGIPKIVRRSRGYIPEYVPLPFPDVRVSAVAVGPELHSTGAVLKLGRAFPTQHVGNVTNLETYDFLREGILHLKSLLGVQDGEVGAVACDAHPGFHSTRLAGQLAERYGAELVPVFHHHAHAASLMVDNSVPPGEECVVLTLDGVGYGEDGAAWGGEVLACTYAGFERVGHLEYLPMVGGDACARSPGRMLACALVEAVGRDGARDTFEELGLFGTLDGGPTEFEVVARGRAVGGFPVTSSTGRFLDAVAVLLGACTSRTYDGEPAMRLEALASHAGSTAIPPQTKRPSLSLPELDLPVDKRAGSGVLVVRTTPMIAQLAGLLGSRDHSSTPELALAVHNSLARALAGVAIDVAHERGVKSVGLTGGVALNSFIPVVVRDAVEKAGLTFLEHKRVPPGDAGISVGQLAVAIGRLSDQ
ncbi:MAG: carbamoyltransferase HypF [Promethearchaeota archaeon]